MLLIREGQRLYTPEGRSRRAADMARTRPGFAYPIASPIRSAKIKTPDSEKQTLTFTIVGDTVKKFFWRLTR